MAEGAPTEVRSEETQVDYTEQLAELEAFKKHGLSSDQIGVLIEEYVRLSDEKKATPKDEGVKKEEVKSKGKQEENLTPRIREEVSRAFPELKDLGNLSEIVAELKETLSSTQQREQQIAERALEDGIVEFIQELDFDYQSKDGKELVSSLNDLIEKTIWSNKEMLTRYMNGDVGVVDDAIDKVRTSPLVKNLRLPKKAVPAKKPAFFGGNSGAPEMESIEALTKDLPKGSQAFRELAMRTHGLVFGKE